MPRKTKKTRSKRKISKKPVKKAKFKKRPKSRKIIKPLSEVSLIQDKNLFLKGPIKKIKIRVIGVGGGGSSIVSEVSQKISLLGKGKISFIVANTDLKALRKTSSHTIRFPFGQNLTFGLGTGMNPKLGRLAAQKEKEKIKKISEGQDLIILVSSLGGGAGSGATPVFAKICQELGILTLGFFTFPFKFEGKKKMEIARESLKKLKPNLNAITILPNERIFQIIEKKTPLRAALSVINKSLAESLEGLLEIIYLPGLINIDFADLRTILDHDLLAKKGKLAYLNTIEVEGADRVNQAIKKLISSPLYSYSIEGAKGILFNITGEKNISLAEISQISKTISELVKGEAKIIFGVSQGKSYKNKIKITLLATDCRPKVFPYQRQIEKPKKSKKEEKLEKKLGQQPRLLKVRKKIKPKARLKIPVKVEAKTIPPAVENKKEPIPERKRIEIKIRRNALQVKNSTEKEEENRLAQEQIWEIPTFLRKKK